MTAEEMQRYLMDAVLFQSDMENDESVTSLRSYEDACIMTRDAGFVIVKDGVKFQVTIVEA